jgi:1-acyl-sn-glycerol-3-phosphate acyltransferase
MDQWHYDPATDFDDALIERLQGYPRRLSFLVSGVRSMAAAVLRFWLRIYHRLTIVGQQNLPAVGSYVLVANHASHLDTLCLLAALPIRRLERVFPIAAEDYFFRSGPRTILATLVFNALRFNRQFGPWRCLSACAHLLQRPGTILIFFPEGRRSAELAPRKFKPGAALLAAGRDIPVVPCHLGGTHVALPKGAWCPRPKAVRLTIGTPRLYTHLAPTKESARQISHELREAVMLLGLVGQQERQGSSGMIENGG